MANIILFGKPHITYSKTGRDSTLADALCEKMPLTLWPCPSLRAFDDYQPLYVQREPIDLFVIVNDAYENGSNFLDALRSAAWGGYYQKTPVILLSENSNKQNLAKRADALTLILPQETLLMKERMAQAVQTLLPKDAMMRPNRNKEPAEGPYRALDERGLTRPLTAQDGTHPLYEKVASFFRPGPQ